MKISIIVALDEKRGIGKDNKMPWHIPEDLARFKKITMGYPVIMGRKTFESLGKPLSGRTNIVITADKAYQAPGCLVVCSLDEAIKTAKETSETNEIFIIGGGQIFGQAIGLADKLYLTLIKGNFQCDTFFPDFSEFKKVVREELWRSGEYKYKFLELER